MFPHILLSENLFLYIYDNPLVCDHRIYWIKVGQSVGWLNAVVVQCYNYSIIDWSNATIPEPPKPRNECLDGTHFCVDNASCKDTLESHMCLCKSGFTGSGFECTDIDECEEGTHNCSENTQCSNLISSFSCDYPCGFTDNGTICSSHPMCPPGAYPRNGAYCEQCPPNTFNNRENNTSPECVRCPSGYVTKGKGSSSISQCKCK